MAAEPAAGGAPTAGRERVSIYDVSLRDGLQNERGFVPTEQKLALLDALTGAGLRRLELTSFVSPRWVPQLADAEALARIVGERLRAPAAPGATAPPSLSALCPNEKGLERAIGAGLREIAVFLSASESHNRRNVNRSVAASLAILAAVVPAARAAGLAVRGYVSTAWGCPYEGPVAISAVTRVAEELVRLGCYELSLGDTIGVATPRSTREVLGAVLALVPAERIALHMHDTRGTALANVLAGLDLGVREFDGSVGGLGGCPYAPGAAGNAATEDLVYMLEGMGLDTGVDLDKLVAAGDLAERLVGRPLPGKVHRAGPFRPRGT
ncbi:MAG: hydroxymethylglutaryl-CoA lyase [Polyangiaceae bacterium]|nr:hydroxymethylglutaryl-CoA lyase [Polyangiaceae bacterium]